MAWTGLGSTSQKNTWCYLINKTLAQMNAERAAGPAGHNLKLKLKEDIDGLMLIVKKLRQLIDQKDERIKELKNAKKRS